MSFDIEKIYSLLPAFYRIQDKKQDEPLKELLSLIADQIAVIEEDLAQLYDDQFIETCAEWVVPYIGDLVGARGLVYYEGAHFSQRAQVANTIRNRRRKGTVSVLEQLAKDVTQWESTKVVEYFQLLATTQYMNHIRKDNVSVSSLRNWRPLEQLNTPFDKMAKTIDVRRIETKRGKYNIPNIGIFLWRLRSYKVTEAPAYKVQGDDRRYLFNALGKDFSLYNKLVPEPEIAHLAEPVNVSIPISRRVLHQYLETYYGKGKSILINKDGNDLLPETASPPQGAISDLIKVCDLSDWTFVPIGKVAIDPELGRIVFPSNQPPPREVKVTYHYGFSTNMGGGEYDRSGSFEDLEPVIRIPGNFLTIQDALNKLRQTGGVIEISDNGYYVETPVINVPAGKTIEIRAADGKRPILVFNGELRIVGEKDSSMILNGLLIRGGRLHVPLKDNNNIDNELSNLTLRHCTLQPGSTEKIDIVSAQLVTPRLYVESHFAKVNIEKSIIGGIRAVEGTHINIRNSIVDAEKDTNIAFSGAFDDITASPPAETPKPGASLTAENCTVIGKVYTTMFKFVSDSIFLASLEASDPWSAAVMAEKLQKGCVRFSYLPTDSIIPQPYRCQPNLKLVKYAKDVGVRSVADLSDNEISMVASRARPVFTSLNFNDAGYCQLSTDCPREIWEGAYDGAEMGAFHDLYQSQRESNLRKRIDEYLRFGMEAGIIYAS